MEDSSSGDSDGVVGSKMEDDNFKDNSKIAEPSAGMIFHSTRKIKAFYQKYANEIGFG